MTSAEIDKADAKQCDTLRQMYEILEQTKYDYDRLQLNTIVSGCMKLFNLLAKVPTVTSGNDIRNYILYKGTSILLRLLAPITPHITHQLWQDLQFPGLIINASWPKGSSTVFKMDEIELVVQINGKLRTKIKVPSSADKKAIENIATNDAKVQITIKDKVIKKIITVPGRLVNIVTGE